MNIITKIILISFLIANIVSCTPQNGKVLVEGATSEVSASLEESDQLDNEKNQNITIKDDLSETTKKNKILNEKLIEVGDRVFFDYDKSSFKKAGIET